jgi:hypothetical protein
MTYKGKDFLLLMKACVCISHKPGIMYLWVSSMTRAFAGTATWPALPIDVIRFFETTTVMSGLAGAPVASMTVTCVNASGLWSAGGASCAKHSVEKTNIDTHDAKNFIATSTNCFYLSTVDSYPGTPSPLPACLRRMIRIRHFVNSIQMARGKPETSSSM